MNVKSFAFVFTLMLFFACNNEATTKSAIEKTYTSPCGCVLNDKQMIMQCPIDAVGDSIVICKVGTNNVIGSNRPPMSWPEFIASEYFGGEGPVVDCKTGKVLFPGLKSPVRSYKNKKLIVDIRQDFHVYKSETKTWIDIELPVWRRKVSAVKGELQISPDSLIFKPVRQGKDAFAQVAKEYEEEAKRTDHYMITNTVYRLLTCAFSGDKLSETRLLNIRTNFDSYYSAHPESQIYLDESLKLLAVYKAYLNAGGKQEFYDLSKFVYFKNQ